MLQIEKNLLRPKVFKTYFASEWRRDMIVELTEEYHYVDLRNFLALDFTMRNGKRAGVLADLTLADVKVSPYWYQKPNHACHS
jgi:hypothetical protein